MKIMSEFAVALLVVMQLISVPIAHADNGQTEGLLRGLLDPYKFFIQRIELPPDEDAGVHDHDGHEIIYVLEGSVTLHVGQTVRTLKTGEVFHVTPGTVMGVGNPNKETASRVLVFYLTEK
ncbi:MAG: cupin domain-containing protein [Cycloclasticus sp.]|nr:hypothetical protein A9Q85_07965 [Cycloclasticus sp. 44_32_T64]